MSYTFAIIGGGLTATSMLCQLVDRFVRLGEGGRRLSEGFSIIVFEKKGVFGPGLPHSEEFVLPFHITNMCSRDMSVRCDRPGDFENWVKQHPEILRRYIQLDPTTPAAGPGCHGELCCHYPRAVMGEYLKSRFDEAVETARELGITVHLRNHYEVTDLIEDGKHMNLTIKDGAGTPKGTSNVDAALLATGHWFKTSNSKNSIPSPWPASRLRDAIPAGEKVGVIGSSLSAVEVALTLTSGGRFVRQPSGELIYLPPESPGKLTLYSRNGLLPRVRGRIGRRPNQHLTCDALRRMIASHPGALTLSSVFELLDRELTVAYGSPVNWQQIINPPGGAVETLRQDTRNARNGDGPEGELTWQTVLVEIFPVVRDLYLNLTLAERERFDRCYNTLFFMHAATQPLINAEKLLALVEAGVVSIVKLGSGYRFERKGTDGPFEFIYTGAHGEPIRDTYPYVVNACGQPRSVESDASLLMQNLLKRGLVQLGDSRKDDPDHPGSYKTGSMVVDTATHRVVRPGTEGPVPSSLPLYAVGAMTRGQMIDASMAYGITRSTALVADDLMALRLCEESI